MALYFFNLITPSGVSADELGSEFRDLDAAYLDACQAIIAIGAEMLAVRRDPHPCRFEVFDGDRRLVMELPFSEVLRPAAVKPASAGDIHQRLRETMRRSQELKASVAAGLREAQLTLAQTQATLRRFRS